MMAANAVYVEYICVILSRLLGMDAPLSLSPYALTPLFSVTAANALAVE